MITSIIIIGIITFIIFSVKEKKKLNEKTGYQFLKTQQKMENEFLQNFNLNSKENDIPDIFKNTFDEDIIDVSKETYQIDNVGNSLKNYYIGVPHWDNKYIYSHTDIYNATSEQREFYGIFKEDFLNEISYELEGNFNYAFVLMFDLFNDYENGQFKITELNSHIKRLVNHYSKTKTYANSLISKIITDFGSNYNEEKPIQEIQNVENLDKLVVKIEDNSIEEVSGLVINIESVDIESLANAPHWRKKYVYSHTDIHDATKEQREFYDIFKRAFLNGIAYKLESNLNYAFVLMFDLFNDYKNGQFKITELNNHIKRLVSHYPKTEAYTNPLISKIITDFGSNSTQDTTSRAVHHIGNNNQSTYFDENDYWALGNRYKSELKLDTAEIALLNKIYPPSNNFFSIDFCATQIIRLYFEVFIQLDKQYIQEKTTRKVVFENIADIIARKQFRYKKDSNNYKIIIKTTPDDFYRTIFKYCENAVREYYEHKRKLNIEEYSKPVIQLAFEEQIISKIQQIISSNISIIKLPDETTEVELNAQNKTRWKAKFDEIKKTLANNPKAFEEAIFHLGKMNRKNTSIENIFFEAAKFIAKSDKTLALNLYINYIFHDLKSSTFNHKPFTKTALKQLFKTEIEQQKFYSIVEEFIKERNLSKALQMIPSVYAVERKKITLNKNLIEEAREKHSGTVELLNEYLQDDETQKNSASEIITPSLMEDEAQKPKIDKGIIKESNPTETLENIFTSKYKVELSEVQLLTLTLFADNNFAVPFQYLEDFSTKQGLFKNQLIESINDICMPLLDDVLIEEEEEDYTIYEEYYQTILV